MPGHEEQLRRLDEAVALARKGPVSPEELVEALGQGWCGEDAMAIGLYAVLATDEVRDALLLSVNHSGDSDSTGIVCGNIAGAVHGPRAIPEEWLANLELREVVAAITEDLLAEFSPSPPVGTSWTQRYPAWRRQETCSARRRGEPLLRRERPRRCAGSVGWWGHFDRRGLGECDLTP